MTRVVRNAAVLCVAGILVASAALANVPDPSKTSIAPVAGSGGAAGFIDVEGSTGGLPDKCTDGRCGDLLVTVRDFANNPIAGSTVVIDFSACSDIQLSCDQLNAATGQSYLGGKKVAGTTNASGQFTFKVQGAANATSTTTTSTSPGTNAGVACAQVYADGVNVGALKVTAYDVNGGGSPSAAVNGADVSLVSSEAGKVSLGAQARGRDDYNHSNTINGADTSVSSTMNGQAGLGTGTQKTAPFCP